MELAFACQFSGVDFVAQIWQEETKVCFSLLQAM